MKKIEWKGGALIAPIPPVMVSCADKNGNSNIITVAWTGILNTVPPKTYISVRPKRFSYNIINESREFVINLTTESLAKSADFCGIYTGKKINKFEKCSLTPVSASKVACPLIDESPLSLECVVSEVISLGSHTMFIADIVCVDVDESLISSDGKLNLDKANLCAFAHGEYFALGKKLGSFGFSATKKKSNKQFSKASTNIQHPEKTNRSDTLKRSKKVKRPYKIEK